MRVLKYILPGTRDMNVTVKFVRKAKIDAERKFRRKGKKFLLKRQSWFAVNVKVCIINYLNIKFRLQVFYSILKQIILTICKNCSSIHTIC